MKGEITVPLTRIKIENYKSIKYCDISIGELNLLIGENGTGKTNVLEAINYFYRNITGTDIKEDIYDSNNEFSNCVKISLFFNLNNFVKIAKSHAEPTFLGFNNEYRDSKYESYYKSILKLANGTKNNIFIIELTQIKGKGIRWNCTYEERSMIKSLYPLFSVDTRNLDITKWAYIWDILAEIGKVSNHERTAMEQSIQELIEKNGELSQKIKGIKKVFSSANLNVKRLTTKEYAKLLTNIYFSGEIIQQKGRELNYFSSGTNSVKYIELLIKSIEELAKTKMKEPLVLLDEPEISLHPNFVDELSYAITDINQKYNIIISTHSARLIKNLLIYCNDLCLYSVKLFEKYTLLEKMKNFSQYSPKSKYRVTDDHVNSYFSKSILFVEGESELELFANPYLKLLFPKLKRVDVFQAMSQEPELNIMSPKKTKTSIPYICLIDMDKALQYDIKTRRFHLDNKYFKDNKQEKFMFRNKKETNTFLYHQRKRIDKMASGLRVHFLKPFYSCKDPSFYEMIDAIKDYLLKYKIFALSTTIEGALLSEHSYEIGLEFLKQKKDEREFNNFKKIIEQYPKTDRVNLLRLAFKGKTDMLQSFKKISKDLESEQSLIIENIMIQKASGWISEFLDYFFKIHSNVPEKISPSKFEVYISDTNNKAKLTREFKYNFPEIYFLIEKIVI